MTNHPNRGALPRPSLMLREIARRYPYAWRIIDLFRRDRGKDGLPDWPEWCYCPMAADPNQYRQWGDHPHHPRGAQMTSDEFAAIRRQLGLSQVELARIMGIGNGEISRIETGERKPTRLHAAFIRYIRDNLNGRWWCV